MKMNIVSKIMLGAILGGVCGGVLAHAGYGFEIQLVVALLIGMVIGLL